MMMHQSCFIVNGAPVGNAWDTCRYPMLQVGGSVHEWCVFCKILMAVGVTYCACGVAGRKAARR